MQDNFHISAKKGKKFIVNGSLDQLNQQNTRIDNKACNITLCRHGLGKSETWVREI